ncbi:MAG: 2'-5' RNA ligase family protein [Actinomycetota bacterium]|nr:2'-5' RNA ligase family protein [Actinomycetota bacterium]HZY64828.1 2'-5' RNA ligase family protein [Rubrobacteraceae bacterium]
MDRYEQVWRRFISERSLEFGGHMDPTWQDGHTLSASLVVPVDAPSLRGRIEPLREAMKTLPFVSLHPDHFMHITLLMLGFLVPEPEQENEISPERLTEIEAECRKTLAGFPAFRIELANLNAFPGAAFIEVYDGGKLDELREAVCQNCDLEASDGLPHLTLAYFQAPEGTTVPGPLVSALSRFRTWPVGEILVDRVDLTLLDLNLDYPPPECLARMPLAGERKSGLRTP